MSIKIDKLSFTYAKKTPYEKLALNNITFNLEKPFFTAIIGETGSGKSTLVEHLNGLIKIQEGKIFVDDFILSCNSKERSKKINVLRKNVGFLFQFSENQLFEITVLKDVMFGPSNFGLSKLDAERVAKEALIKCGLDESYFEKSPHELSGGEKRRVALAGVLASNPKYLILDEPTAGLDNIGVMMLMNTLTSLYNEGISILIVTHDMDIVLKYCKDVVLLHNGKLIMKTKPSLLFKNDLTKYGISEPKVFTLAKYLIENNIKINLDNIIDLDTFFKELDGAKKDE